MPDSEVEQPLLAEDPEISALDDTSISTKDQNPKQAENADEALKAIDSSEETIEIDEATKKRLLRKIDLHLLPVRDY
jgi:hypothetical protein